MNAPSSADIFAELSRTNELYKAALKAGRLGVWETDLVAGTRVWTPEGAALFGHRVPQGVATPIGEGDLLQASMHPDDRPLLDHYHHLMQSQDEISAEYRIIAADGSVRYLRGQGVVLSRAPDGAPQRTVHIVADVTEQKEAEERNELLLKELGHRSKNLLAVVSAIAYQTVQNAEDMQLFKSRFRQRLAGLSASVDLLVQQDWQGTYLHDLIFSQLMPFLELPNERLRLDGSQLKLDPRAAQTLGLVLHELATNAVKYGALSNGTGRIDVGWTILDAGSAGQQFQLSWLERGGPDVAIPERSGFGRIVIEKMVAETLNADVTVNFGQDGLEWHMTTALETISAR